MLRPYGLFSDATDGVVITRNARLGSNPIMNKDTSAPRRNLLICLALVTITVPAYWQVWSFDLVSLDDGEYIARNPYVLLGIRHAGVEWAFTAFYHGAWHPMVWLSYMADSDIARGLAARGVRLGPGNVGVFHLTNLAQHIVSTLLLFFIFLRITGSRWRGAFVAGIFAIHPLNVESVAWVAERKNTLSAVFFMLTMMAYLNYARRPGLPKYALVVALFALGLMAKAVLVTLPLVFLALDYWPLRRFALTTQGHGPARSAWPLLREKLPMLGLSVASGALAFVAQRSAAAVAPDEVFPIGVRIANAFFSCVKYIGLTILPRNLSVCYVHPGRSLPSWEVALSAAFVVAMTILAIRFARRLGYLMVGWLWFVVTMLPVIGIVQVGDQALADRYVYIPMIGLLTIAACGMPDLLARLSGTRYMPALAAAACVAVMLLALTAYKQVGYWRDSETMYRQVLRVNQRSRICYTGLGSALDAKGRHTEAQVYLRKAVEIDPTDLTSRTNLGISLAKQGKLDDAIGWFRQALELSPGDPRALYNLANVLVMRGKLKQAAESYFQAVISQPFFVEAHIGLADVSVLLGRTADAVSHYSEAIRLNPDDPSTHFRLAGALEDQGKVVEAVRHYREALRLNPQRWDAANNLAWILATQTDPRCSDPREAVGLAEDFCKRVGNSQPTLLDTLAVAYAATGRYDAAVGAETRAITLAESNRQTQVANGFRARLRLFQARRATTCRPPLPAL